MLLSLKINNYALIDELFVEFDKGLNIITGETGAGKSILLGAFGLILGKRADTSVLSDNNKKCIVEAEFNIQGYQLEALFDKNDVDFETHTVFRREILSSGKSRAFINDTPVNLTTLQKLALQLVDIHSQHQNLLLNQQDFLLSIIDRYCKHDMLVNTYKKSFKVYRELADSFETAKEEYKAIKDDIDYLTFQVNELSEASIKTGEIDTLEQNLTQLDNAGEIKTALHAASECLSVEEHGVLDNLQTVAANLNKITAFFPLALELTERLESARIELKELDADIVSGFEKLEFDPNYQEQLRTRLDLLYGLLQKHKAASEEELLEKLKQLNEKLSKGVDGEFDLEKQKKELQKQKEELQELADKLSGQRENSFPIIESKVESLLKDLGISHGKLQIEREKKELMATGIDNVSFLFSANKNHPLQNVSKIASGGELSRLMLSVKALLSSSSGMPTIILDEIDTGVSGEIADKVGNIIRTMSSGMQVINITHLPQVASKAEAHYKVFKDHSNGQTITKLKKLSSSERLEEIAKMLSGEELSEAAIENARVLLGK